MVYDVYQSTFPQVDWYFYVDQNWYQYLVDKESALQFWHKLPYIIRVKIKR